MTRKPGTDIWVYGDTRNRRFFGFSLNTLEGAGKISRALSGKTVVLLMGPSDSADPVELPGESAAVSIDAAAKECIEHGADLVHVFDHPALVPPRADIHSRLIASAVKSHSPKVVLFPLTDLTREIAARCARINEAGLIADCADLILKEESLTALCPSWGGEIMAELGFASDTATGFATIQPHAFQAVHVEKPEGRIEHQPVEFIKQQIDKEPERIKLLSRSPEPPEHRKLEDAETVVVGGAGLGSMEGFGLARDLAAAMGGEVGATRPPVLQHWVDEDRLIGQTGKNVHPKLLFSIGTSGAVQYTAGISEAEMIVAINRESSSLIFETADFGIIADAKDFLPLFTEKVRQTAMRHLADSLSVNEKTEEKSGFGEKVRKLREANGWSIETMAQKTDRSPEFLEQLENDEISPSVSFLLRLARALNVDPGSFLNSGEKAAIHDRRAREFIKRTGNYSYQTLTPGAENEHLRAFMITIEPGQAHKPVAYKHEGEEFIYVISGSLELKLDNKTHNLKPGESIRFNSETPHTLKSKISETTHCLVVLYTP